MFFTDVPLISRLVDEIDVDADSTTLLREVYDNGEYYQIHLTFDPKDESDDPKPYFLVVDKKGYAQFCTDEYDEAISQAEVYIHSNWLLKTLTEQETGNHYVECDASHSIN